VRNIRKMNWSSYQDRNSVNRRAGGRRRINAERKARAWKRREEIKELIGGNFLLLGTSFARGLEATLAEYFGVHRSTISRDKEAMLVEWRKDHVCPKCGAGSSISLKALARLAKLGLDVGCTANGCARKSVSRA
jgi:hypothetical protein